MVAANDRLKRLEKDLISFFPFPSHAPKKTESSSYYNFSGFVHTRLATVLYIHATELYTLEPTSPNLPGWFLTTHLNQAGFESEIDFACSDCFPAHPRSRAVEIESSRDSCSELLLLQHRVVVHDECEGSELWETLVRLSHEVQGEASGMLESHGLHENATWAKSLGVYHPDILLFLLPGTTQNFSECLERSWLHMRMDNVDGWDDVDSIGSSVVDVSIVKDGQDILGRTALIIACQEAWTEIVGWLLEEEADPGLTTIYGSLRLHYAAVNGSINICEQLLAHKTRFDIKAKDCVGKTALDYAREKENQDVVGLLSAEYAVADQALEKLERARSLQAGLETHEVQGSHFV